MSYRGEIKMQTEVKEKKEEIKYDHYMPVSDPTANKMYQLIKWKEREILRLIAFTIPEPKSREYMNETRGQLKHIVCRECEHLGQTVQSKLRVQVLIKDELLSMSNKKLVLTQEWQDSKKKLTSCEGCIVLRLKQIATGYIKGRRFKQI